MAVELNPPSASQHPGVLHHTPSPEALNNRERILNPAQQASSPEHHATSAESATGTTADPASVSASTQQDSHPASHHGHGHDHDHDHDHHHHHPPLVVEKSKPLSTPPDYSDHEKAEAGVVSTRRGSACSHHNDPKSASSRFRRIYRQYRPLFHLIYFLFFTGWWIASLVLHRHDKNWVVPFLLWLAISLRLLFNHVPSRHVSGAIRWLWAHSALVIYEAIPTKLRTPLGAVGALAVMLIGSFVSDESAENSRANRAISLLGMLLMLAIFWATSKHRSRVNWRTVIAGMLSQYVIGLFVLRTGVGYDVFRFIADRAGDLLGFARQGVAFLTNDETAQTPWFFFSVVPAIIFFISLVQVLFYVGFLQWFIQKCATFVFWGLGVSGAEAVVAAATPFIGQGESAMLVRPFVPHMTKAEIHQILTCGFATISGSVLVGYINLGLNAGVLVSSCIMSIPASLAISKLRYPETEETLTAGRVTIPADEEHHAENALHAFANGAWLGIKIGGTIIASLLCIIAAVGLLNALLTWWGRYLNINDPTLTLQTILGYMLWPVAFFLGVPRQNDYRDILLVARLISQKVITNEYKAFTELTKDAAYQTLSPRSRLIATYALCGFGNIGSLGVQIGILGQLAPSRGGDVSRLAFSALVSGVAATLTSAAVAGLVITDELQHFGGQAS
ncbi:hypothetical protein E4U60_007302 [Claviceps pazoutovae]|uniref:Uncharacterized protein n=1 Tax=Claviceps pazoutovae TaxID=1649127 RepID=A0A9P7MFK6_9HYPO|nr:hypothetical protein E4U60_007302 [Claviceps pazoutovae]